MTDRYKGPADMVPTHRYSFTGNASEEWSDLFQSAYRYCLWAKDYAKSMGYQDDDYVINFEVGGFTKLKHCHSPYEADGSECCDSITIWAPNGFDSTMWGEFVGHVLHKVPCGYPDGNLTIAAPGGVLNDEKGLVFHVWHD
jgi:hypothetical protein